MLEGIRIQPGDKYTAAEDHIFTAEWKKNDSGNLVDKDDSGKPDDKDDPVIDDNDGSDNPTANDTEKDYKSNGAKTGDESNPIMWIAMMILSAVVITALIARRRHGRN